MYLVKQKKECFTKEGLDRTLANTRGMELFSNSSCQLLLAIKSDHSLLIVSILRANNQTKRKNFIFRYKVAWEKVKEECAEIIKEAWNEISNSAEIHNRIQKYKWALLKWKNIWKKKERERQRTQVNLLGHFQHIGTGQHLAEDQKIQVELQKILEEEDIKQKQRAKQHWLQNGDKNMRFYHLHANQKRKINKISQIMDFQWILIQ